MSSHTRSFSRQIRAGSHASNFRSVGPVVFSTAQLSSEGKLGVKGTLSRNGATIDFETRWATITPAEVVKFIEVGTKDETIQTIRVVSQVAGSTWGAGTEEALLISLTDSKEAIALAETYGLIYEITVPVGQGDDEVEVTTSNAIAVTLSAACEAMGLLQYPGIEKAAFRSRADSFNPTYQDCIAQYDKDGTLPVRATSRQPMIDTEFAKNFVSAAPRNRGRNYGENTVS